MLHTDRGNQTLFSYDSQTYFARIEHMHVKRSMIQIKIHLSCQLQ